MRARHSKGFTLIEILIAMTIFTVVMLAVYGAFQAGLGGFRRVGTEMDATLLAGQVFDRLETDLTLAFSYSKNESFFEGSGDRMSFLTVTASYERDDQGTLGIKNRYSRVIYSRQESKFLRLCLKNGQSLRSEQEHLPDEIASPVQNITFNYGRFDKGAQDIVFSDLWEEKTILPSCVKVVLTMAGSSGGPAKAFERTFHLWRSE